MTKAFFKKHKGMLIALLAIPWSMPIAFFYVEGSTGASELMCIARDKLSDDTHYYMWMNGENGGEGAEHVHYCKEEKA